MTVAPDGNEAWRALQHGACSRISQESVKIFEGDFPVTISLGIAVGYAGHQAHELISAADAALAEAKKAGRDRAELARK